jgi:hypothetical protein
VQPDAVDLHEAALWRIVRFGLLRLGTHVQIGCREAEAGEQRAGLPGFDTGAA